MSGGNYLYYGPSHIIPVGILARRQEMIQYIEKNPNSLSGWLEVSSLSLSLDDKEYALYAAKKALEINPNDIFALERIAQNPAGTPAGQIASLSWYNQALQRDPENLPALIWHFQNALVCQEYAQAFDYAKTLVRLEPHSPAAYARMGRVLSLMNNQSESFAAYAQASQLCSKSSRHFPDCRESYVKPLYTQLSGDRARSEQESETICSFEGIGIVDFSNPRYPKHWSKVYQDLKSRVEGQDVYIFGNGPSLADIVADHHMLTNRSFVSVGMSSFELAANDILKPLGRNLDFACVTHQDMILGNIAAINNYMRISPDFHLIVPLYILEMLRESGKSGLLQSHRIFWNDIHSNFLPHPGEPIHIPAHNTLSSALSSIYILNPKRIFLFGFDGRIRGSDPGISNSLYYKENDASYLTTRGDHLVRKMTGDWLFLDSFVFNENISCILRHLRLLFGLSIIPIYNVCVNSAISVFPKIELAHFYDLTKDNQNVTTYRS